MTKLPAILLCLTNNLVSFSLDDNKKYFFFTDIRRWQTYVEPGDEAEVTSSPAKRLSRNLEMTSSTTLATSPEADGDAVGGAGFGEEELFPLPEDTLTRNLGLDLIVVVTKVGEAVIRRISGLVRLDHPVQCIPVIVPSDIVPNRIQCQL